MRIYDHITLEHLKFALARNKDGDIINNCDKYESVWDSKAGKYVSELVPSCSKNPLLHEGRRDEFCKICLQIKQMVEE